MTAGVQSPCRFCLCLSRVLEGYTGRPVVRRPWWRELRGRRHCRALLTPVPSSQHRKRRRQGVVATEGDSDRCADLSGVGCSWRRHPRCGHGPWPRAKALWCADLGGVSCGGVGTAGAALLTPVPSSHHGERSSHGRVATGGDSDRCVQTSVVWADCGGSTSVRVGLVMAQHQKKGKGQTPPASPRPASPRQAQEGAERAARTGGVFQATAAVLQNGAQLDLDMSAKDDLWEFITSRQEWAWASADTANASLFGVVADAVRRFVATPLLAELFDSESPQGESDVDALHRLVYNKLPIGRDEYMQLGVGPLYRMVAKVLQVDCAAGRVLVEMQGHGERVFSVPISSDLLTPVRPQVQHKWREARERRKAAEADRVPEDVCVPAAVYRQPEEEAVGARRPAAAAGSAGRLPGREFQPPRPFASSGPALGQCGHSRPKSGLFCDTCQNFWEGQEQRAAPSEGQSMRCPHCKHGRLPIDAPKLPVVPGICHRGQRSAFLPCACERSK